MLYVNGKLLNVNNSDEKYELKDEAKEFKVKQKQLKETYGKVVAIKSQRRPYIDEHTKILVTVPTLGLPMQAITVENGERKEWIYSSSPLVSKDGKLKQDMPTMLVKNNGELYLDLEDDIELAFFLIEKSGEIGKSEDEHKHFFIHNKKRVNQVQANARRKEGKLLSVIYDELKDTDIKLLAKKYGIQNVDTYDSSEMRNMLYEKVIANEELKKKGVTGTNGIDEFVKDSNIDLKTQMAAMVQDAIDLEILLFNQRERRWEIDYKDGRLPYLLMEVSVSAIQNPNDALLDYLFADDTAMERLRTAMGDNLKDTAQITEEMILNERKPPVLRKYARILFDWNASPKMTAQELQEELIKRLNMKT